MLSSLLEEFAGKVDLIYIDPPFATGADFKYSVQIGDGESKLEKLPSMMEVVAYRDMWKDGVHSYLKWLAPVLADLSTILAPSGSIYVHCDATVSHLIRGCLQHHAKQPIRREIIWQMKSRSGYKSSARNWIRDHDTIFFLNRGSDPTFHTQYEPYSEEYIRKMFKGVDEDGRRYRQRENRRYYEDEEGIPHGDVWTDISSFQTATRSAEYTGYPTQKPEDLLERIINASSNEGDLILDCFLGSGTTAAAAEKLGRRWIGVDIGRFAIKTSRQRLLDIPNCKPFELQNLGKYERRYWHGFGGGAVAEYLTFILELFGAQSKLGQFEHVHGLKAGRAVHVGATDSPVTRVEIDAAVEECRANGIFKLDVLGWEFEMGVVSGSDGRDDRQGNLSDVSVRHFRIPSEIMDQRNIDAGDVNFFELAVAQAEVIPAQHDALGTVSVHLTDYIANVDPYMRKKLNGKLPNWEEWIDYWSVDFEYDGGVFINQWQAYRSRQDRSLLLESDPHTYATPGEKTLVVKVIDIFGNDTTLLLDYEVKA